jgi:hypothetical protein
MSSRGPQPYRSKHHPLLHHGGETVTGSLQIDLGIRHDNFQVVVSFDGDAGGLAADVGRLRSENDGAGKFTIYVEDLFLTEAAPPTISWVAATTAVPVSFIVIESDAA